MSIRAVGGGEGAKGPAYLACHLPYGVVVPAQGPLKILEPFQTIFTANKSLCETAHVKNWNFKRHEQKSGVFSSFSTSTHQPSSVV